MIHSNRAGLFIFGLAFCLVGAAAYALDPSKPPGGNFDLNHWYLQLPTSNGILTGASGSVDSLSVAQLMAGATNSYFYTGADGAMVFWVPDNGAHTGGSDHPRSELREQLVPGNNNTNWTVYGTHVLTAQCKVLQVPSDTKKVCIGQIHEPNTKPDGSASAGNEQMIMFDLKNQKIYVNINLDGNLSSSFSQTLISGSSVATNTTINYTISVVNGLLTIIVNNITNSWNLLSGTNINGHVAQNWDLASGNTMYFKAGDYNQTSNQCNCATDGAKVAFYALSRDHAPSITNQPAAQAVTVGSNVTFSVAALGTPPLKYAWRLNGAPINLATNATFTIPNVQLTNAGGYSAIVTDITGAVTSSVVNLTVSPPAPIANFTANPTNGVAPLQVIFTDASSGSPTNWAWDFDSNGTIDSTTENPTNTYASSGTYTVRLIVSNGGGSSTNTRAAYVNVITPLQSWLNHYGVPGDLTDADGDGLGNSNEFLAGFNPTSSAAYLHIVDVEELGNDVNVTYLGANGDNTWSPGIASRTNVLEYSSGADDGNYTNGFVSTGQTNVLSGGNGSGLVTNMVDPGGATNNPSRYYRIRVLVP